MNNDKIFLISEQYIKKNSAIMNNVDDKFIQSHIKESQDIHIQNIIGSPLYSNIINEFTAYANRTGGTITDYVSTINITLVDDYITPCLLYYTQYESMIDLSVKMTNKGLVQQYTDNSQVIDITMFNIKRADVKNKAEYFAERLMKFLIQNMNTYTLYRDWTATVDTITPSRNSYSCGMYLGKGSDKCWIDRNERPRN